MSVTYSYDQRGRLKVETATLTVWGVQPVTAKTFNEYDALGRPYKRSSRILNGATLETASSYTLQGWVDTLSVSLNGSQLFVQTLGYDSADVLSGTTPQYSGLMAKMIERWMRNGRRLSGKTEGYAYDQAGRLSKSIKGSTETEYAYDEKGNIRSVRVPSQNEFTTYSHMGYRLISSKKQDELVSKIFLHDALGRMTRDGLTGQQISYNDLDLIGNITRNDTTLVNYYYLADGTKISALDGSGEGLVYRGPFVYRTSDGGSSLTLESAAFGGGLMTPSGAMFYVTDYLGSVRAVVDGQTGELYKASNYAVFGEESVAMAIPQGDNPPQPLATAVLPDGQTLRDGYTGKEDQDMDFSTGYTDFGARQYSPSLRRWMTPDPLSEKYYGISPYAFCNNNPVNFVDPDGEFPLLSNIVGGFVSAGVEYGSQVIGNFFSRGFSVDAFTDVDLFDIGVAFGEGFITSGTNVARKIVTKSAIGLAGEVARNALDVEFKDGEVQTPVLNSFGKVLTDTAIGVASEAISVDVNITPFNGVSNTQAVRAAREAAGARGASLSSEAADGIRKSNTAINAQKYAANQVVSEGVGSVPGSVAGEVLKRLNDEDQY